ncbi:YqhG family protein [Aneurinibacillus sp. Ricciae_BoGa-3]|uniref:YqhG family protein n=1 Tax=Aneurinibacillus sp. Ricciae_BoGa-3 TaxID=3022697 RepID=UPI0023407E41|nr:YqhG family protein [Aneurinibacillus sp. Ricciae_BoGa-3]WCK53346.1 YqhG family protein [Aneurinibacillus sp. Ricciae_BoGa-3]
MKQEQVRAFLERYLDAHKAVYTEVHPSYFKVRLPIEVDKDLGNRPFYWTYVERLNIEPQPMFMTLIFDKENLPDDVVRGEEISFGSPRLLQFFSSARKRGQYVRLFERPGEKAERAGLIPWLNVNYKISFICDRKKDILLSLGINMINGTIFDQFFSKMENYNLSPVMADYTFTVRPVYGIKSAANRLEQYVSEIIQREDPAWAVDARQRLNEELSIIEYFYTKKDTDEEDAPDYSQKRIDELRWQHEPRIEVDIINGGLFYLLEPQGNPLNQTSNRNAHLH